MKHEDSAVGEVGLLGHLGAAALHVVPVELVAALDLGVVLALQVLAEGGDHAGAAPRRQRVEDQDAGSEKEQGSLLQAEMGEGNGLIDLLRQGQ